MPSLMLAWDMVGWGPAATHAHHCRSYEAEWYGAYVFASMPLCCRQHCVELLIGLVNACRGWWPPCHAPCGGRHKVRRMERLQFFWFCPHTPSSWLAHASNTWQNGDNSVCSHERPQKPLVRTLVLALSGLLAVWDMMTSPVCGSCTVVCASESKLWIVVIPSSSRKKTLS